MLIFARLRTLIVILIGSKYIIFVTKLKITKIESKLFHYWFVKTGNAMKNSINVSFHKYTDTIK